MKKIIALILITGCTPYTASQKRAFGLYTVATAADILSTRQALQQGCRELNPLLREHPSDSELIAFKGIMTGVFYLFGEVFPEQREGMWNFLALISGAAATNNLIQGVQ